MATVVSITNPITGAVEQVDKLDATAQQIDDAVALAPQISNPNLLDNPNFAVNQRGIASVPASPSVYTVDRWKTYGYTGATVSVLENGHISISGGNASAGSALLQILEQTLPAGTYTLSVKVDACENPDSSGNYGVLYARKGTTIVSNAAYIKGTGVTQLTFTVSDGEVDGISISCLATSTIELECAKLELGSQQTLAHQDAGGNWVLNEIPDYGEQLARCQRYFIRYTNKIFAGGINTAGTAASLDVCPFVSMRTIPAIATAQMSYLRGGGVEGTPTISDALVQGTKYSFYISVPVSGIAAKHAVYAYFTELQLTADL